MDARGPGPASALNGASTWCPPSPAAAHAADVDMAAASPALLLCGEAPDAEAGLGLGLGQSADAGARGATAHGRAFPSGDGGARAGGNIVARDPCGGGGGGGGGACARAGSCGQLRGCAPQRRPLATLSAPAAAQRANGAGLGLRALGGACHRLDAALQAGGCGRAPPRPAPSPSLAPSVRPAELSESLWACKSGPRRHLTVDVGTHRPLPACLTVPAPKQTWLAAPRLCCSSLPAEARALMQCCLQRGAACRLATGCQVAMRGWAPLEMMPLRNRCRSGTDAQIAASHRRPEAGGCRAGSPQRWGRARCGTPRDARPWRAAGCAARCLHRALVARRCCRCRRRAPQRAAGPCCQDRRA